VWGHLMTVFHWIGFGDGSVRRLGSVADVADWNGENAGTHALGWQV